MNAADCIGLLWALGVAALAFGFFISEHRRAHAIERDWRREVAAAVSARRTAQPKRARAARLQTETL